MRFAFGEDGYSSMAEESLEDDRAVVRKSVQPSRADRKMVFAKAETAAMQRELLKEHILQAGGVGTIPHLDGFRSHTLLISSHGTVPRQPSPTVFYFSMKKWAPGGSEVGRSL